MYVSCYYFYISLYYSYFHLQIDYLNEPHKLVRFVPFEALFYHVEAVYTLTRRFCARKELLRRCERFVVVAEENLDVETQPSEFPVSFLFEELLDERPEERHSAVGLGDALLQHVKRPETECEEENAVEKHVPALLRGRFLLKDRERDLEAAVVEEEIRPLCLWAVLLEVLREGGERFGWQSAVEEVLRYAKEPEVGVRHNVDLMLEMRVVVVRLQRVLSDDIEVVRVHHHRQLVNALLTPQIVALVMLQPQRERRRDLLVLQYGRTKSEGANRSV